MQVRVDGFTSPGNRTFSDMFFAGIKVLRYYSIYRFQYFLANLGLFYSQLYHFMYV